MDQSQDFQHLENKQSLDMLRRPSLSDSQQQYTTNINQLISEPRMPSATQFFLATIFQLSQYLFKKKTQIIQDSANNISFDFYLNEVSRQINVYENLHKKAKQLATKQFKQQVEQSTQQLLQCFSAVPYAFFNNSFILDFGQLAKNVDEIKNRQQQLNDYLDMVEINLFSQIHNKFHQYYNVVANFQYMSQALVINIKKNHQARQRLNKVKVDFIQKSYNLKAKITHRQNLQKTIKLVKIIKSLKKLPSIVKQILQSSLPYQCLSLLKSTKQSINQVSSLKCMSKVSQTIRESESLVQMGLNKRYADELYLYLQESQNVNLQEGWDRINSNGCVDVSGFNNSMLGMSGFLEESVLQMQPSTSKNKRNEGKQFEIALILLQSYKFMSFPVDLIRIKVTNSLRVFCKKFDSQLTVCLKKILQQKNEKILQSQQSKQKTQKQTQPQNFLKLQDIGDDQQALSQVVEKITVIFYVKHLLSYNQIMKDTIQKFLGYLHTLLCEFDQSKNKDSQRFLILFRQQLSILPAVTKIIIQKLTFLMTLKNINGASFTQFKQWISVLEYWKRYTDYLVEQNPLISMERQGDEIQQAISDTVRRMIGVLNINATISELMLNYVTTYHQNTISSQLEPSFAQQSWQSVQIPTQFVQVLNNIAQWHQIHLNQNVSVTILNDSKQIKNLNKSLSQDYSNVVKKINKFRVLKSNVMVDGVRYKISVSFLLLCQFIDQYVKMMRSMPQCRKFIYQRMLNLIQYYNSRTKQLILQAKARQFQKMKSKNISAKHICIVHNCLSVLFKLVKQITYSQVADLKLLTLENLQTHKNQLIAKLSYLIKSKVQSTVASFLINKDQKVAQVNLTLLNVFVQMMGIIDQFLQFDDKKAVFKESMQIFMNKYFKQLLIKGSQYSTQNKILVQKMRFLRQYFPDELEVMQKQAKSRSAIQN